MADPRRERVTTDAAPNALGPYSQGIVHGGLLWCSGQTPLDPATGALVEGDIGAQTEQALRNLQAVCAAAGTTLDRALRCGIFCTDLADFAQINAAYATFFGEIPPARSTVQVTALPVGARVEIEAVVALSTT